MKLKKLSPTLLLSASISAIATLPACHTLDNDRIPPAPVYIVFNTVADWDIYGTPGALDYRVFNKSERNPSNFPWTATTETGFGGVLLVGDAFGAPVAYDLACPYEMRADKRIRVRPETHDAECPHCHSVYDIFSNYGHPLAGPAAEYGYGLRLYYVGAGRAGQYMVVSSR